MVKKLTFLLCLTLAVGLVGSTTVSGEAIDIRIATGTDDAEEHLNAGMDLTSSDLEIPYEDAGTPATDEQLIGVRWGVPIAKGATLMKAYIEFQLKEIKTTTNIAPVNVIIEGQLDPNPPAFTSAAKNITNRPRTKAQVKWTIPPGMAVDAKFQTPDISPILNELSNQDGWAKGNAMVLIIRDDKDSPSTGLRCVYTNNGSAANAPMLHLEVFNPLATKPDPADGAQEITSPLFQWTAGDGAVMHQVYMGTNPELSAADIAGAPIPMAMYFHVPGLTPGVKYYWRVDETAADGTVTKGNVWNFTAMPLTAHFPSPADQATDVKTAGSLKWAAGQSVAGHMVYLSADKAAVETGAPSAQVAAGPDVKYDFTGLNPFTTYYWRVDEIGGTGQIIAGPVWSFSTISYLSMADAAVTLNYNNSAAPFTSQVTLTGAADWTAYGLSDLVVQFTGRAGPKGGLTYSEPNQTYALAGSGTDIWNNGDQFHYAYKTLNGDGTMVARVVSIGAGTNTWAKGGVMIRQGLAAGSTHAYMPITANSDGTAGNGASFQRRLAADGASSNSDSTTKVAPPYWVKIERKGNDFSGSISPDGQTWTQLGTAQTIAMTDPVYIGLAVTSHVDAATLRTFKFDSVSTTGNVTPVGPFSAWDDIGIASNDPQPIYAAVEDNAGKLAVVSFGDPAATQIAQPWTWKIPLASFVGVDLKNVAKLYVGAGDLLSPVAGGSGAVTLNSVRVVRPVALVKGADVTMPGDNVLGVPNNGNWPAAEPPWLAIDDKSSTKFLHFNGKTDPVGFQVQVLAGPTIVTGLTFTTANDAAERDPVAFELSGSNDGFQGPWTPIASGKIADFNDPAAAWPRFTKNATAIAFENKIAYKFYQVLFTAVRNRATANSMQIAEVELINGGPSIMWVSEACDDLKDSVRDDQPWITFLTAQGYNIEYRMGPDFGNGYWRTLDDAKIAALNAVDLVVVSRNMNSGEYNNGTEPTQWNSVKTPLILMSPHVTRSTHWKWFDTTTLTNATPLMQPVDPKHAAFTGVTLDAKGQIAAVDATRGVVSFPGLKTAGNGTVLATRADTGDIWIAAWEAGVEFYAGAGQIAGGPRVFFAGGTQEAAATATAPANGRGEFNLTDSSKAVFLNVVDMLLP